MYRWNKLNNKVAKMTTQLTQEQGAHIKKQIAIEQKNRKSGIVKVFPQLSEVDKKALKIDIDAS